MKHFYLRQNQKLAALVNVFPEFEEVVKSYFNITNKCCFFTWLCLKACLYSIKQNGNIVLTSVYEWTSILFNRVKFTGHQVGLWWLGYQPCSLGSQPPRPSESINLACLRQPMSADQFIYWLASSKTNFGDDRDNTFWSYLTKAESSFTFFMPDFNFFN